MVGHLFDWWGLGPPVDTPLPVKCMQDRHWTVVHNLKLRRALLIVQLKASSILVQFVKNDRNTV